MTSQLNRYHASDNGIMLSNTTLSKIVIWSVSLIVLACNFCTAQNLTFPRSTIANPTSAFQSSSSVDHDWFDTINEAPTSLGGTTARPASNKTYSSHPTFSQASYSDPQHPSYDNTSPYRPALIQSARQSAEQFRTIARSTTSIATRIADENANFADQWANLAENYDGLSDRLFDATTKLNMTTRDFEDVRSKISQYGLTPTVGLLLQHKQEQLEIWNVDDSLSLFATQELAQSRQHQLELEMVRFDGRDSVKQTAELLAEAGIDPKSFQNTALVSQIQGLLYQRRQWVGALQQGYHDYQQKLSQLDSTTTAAAQLSNDYGALISRHITWIRSGKPLSIVDLQKAKLGMTSLFDSRRSGDLGYSLKIKWDANRYGGIGLLVCLALIMIARWRAKSWLVGIGSRKEMLDSTANSRKVVAGILTVLISAAYPSVLYAIARWLSSGVVSETSLQSASGFYAASLVALLIEVPRQLLCNYGYLDKHVDVELPRRQRATAYLTLIGFGLVLAAYVITVSGTIDHGMWRDSAARIGFIATLILVAWTAHLSLRPTGGFLEPLIAKFGGSVIHRLRFVFYSAAIGFPLAMAALSAVGFGFTANVFIGRAIVTLVSLLVAATLWSAVKILSAGVWQMLTGSTPERRFDEYGEVESDSVNGILAEHYLELKHHLAFLCQCALVLGAIVCFGWLWIDLFPNVRMGNPVLWTVQETVAQSGVSAISSNYSLPAIAGNVVETTPVTALHLVIAGATLFVAFQLAKLLPALFDAVVLQRVSFDEGMEHFSLVLGRCLLFGAGCYIACALLGVRWQTIQWLAVGLAIGLGFGLQDMVRNLFGGLIVLFEKPARLGDLVTVGRVTGRVAAQKFRTTVLTDDEGREVIVPNKNFVSEEVINWMGAGRLNVIPIEVAVKRDERSADICRSLQELAIEQPDVLLTPAPQATLICVGKNFQRIEVRAWIEEGQDASRFRDLLLKTVTKYLRENDLLVAAQPPQPSMHQATDDDLSGTSRSQTSRSRKRSA